MKRSVFRHKSQQPLVQQISHQISRSCNRASAARLCAASAQLFTLLPSPFAINALTFRLFVPGPAAPSNRAQLSRAQLVNRIKLNYFRRKSVTCAATKKSNFTPIKRRNNGIGNPALQTFLVLPAAPLIKHNEVGHKLSVMIIMSSIFFFLPVGESYLMKLGDFF